jgi:hypothetical protein
MCTMATVCRLARWRGRDYESIHLEIQDDKAYACDGAAELGEPQPQLARQKLSYMTRWVSFPVRPLCFIYFLGFFFT